MKFGELLRSHIVKEWSDYYVSYEELKNHIKYIAEYYHLNIEGTELDLQSSVIEQKQSDNNCINCLKIFMKKCQTCTYVKQDIDRDDDVVDFFHQQKFKRNNKIKNNNKLQKTKKTFKRKISKNIYNLRNKKESNNNNNDTEEIEPLIKIGSIKSINSINSSIDSNSRQDSITPLNNYNYIKDDIKYNNNNIKYNNNNINDNNNNYSLESNNISGLNVKHGSFYERTHTKIEIINDWQEKIESECKKVNRFYLVVEKELIKEFELIGKKLRQYSSIKNSKYKRNKSKTIDISDNIENNNNNNSNNMDNININNTFYVPSWKKQKELYRSVSLNSVLSNIENKNNLILKKRKEIEKLNKYNLNNKNKIYNKIYNNDNESVLLTPQENKIKMTIEERQLEESIYRVLVVNPLEKNDSDDYINDNTKYTNTKRKKYKTRKKHRDIQLYQMKLSIFVLYQRLVGLSNYASLNKIGFNKILKKFDKNLNTNCRNKLMNIIINKYEFSNLNRINNVMEELYELYSNEFENGDIHNGKLKLMDSIIWSGWSTSSFLKMGIKLGLVLGLSCWVTTTWLDKTVQLEHHTTYVYRSMGCFILWIWLFSFNIYIWTKFRINYVFIFEFDPRTRLSYHQLFDEAATLTIIWLLNLIIYIKMSEWWSRRYSIIFPASMLVFMLAQLFLPFFGLWSSKKILLDAIYQTLIAPFGRVRFRDFYIGDVMTSMVKVFADLYMAICLLVMDEYDKRANHGSCHDSEAFAWPIIICIPYWCRFFQCINRYFITGDRIPHLPNAGKYALSMTVTLFGALHGTFSHPNGNWTFWRSLWLVDTIVTTLYLFFWDVKMDWVLFPTQSQLSKFKYNDKLENIHPILGRPLEYPPYIYYICIFLDFIMRYFWTYTLVPTSYNPYVKNKMENEMFFIAFVEILELFRRCMWGMFRVERAHLTKKSEFRSYEYIPLLYEHVNLLEIREKEGRPRSMFVEIGVMIALLLTITVILWITYSLD